jgi:predicted phage terminase large subunit-like protein
MEPNTTAKQTQIQYSPNSEHQRRFHASPAFERALIAGYGSGKTLAGCAEMLRLSIENRGCDAMVISPNFPMAKKTVIPALKRLFQKSGIKFSYNSTDKLFEVEWGSRIWIATADTPDSLKGTNLSHAWMDEPFIMAEQVYFEVLGRIREPRAKRLALLLTGTPEGMNWGYEQFVEQTKPNREIIWGSTTDNPALPQMYVDNLKSRYDARLQAMYMEGKFIDFGSNVIKPEWFCRYDEAPPHIVWNFAVDTAYGKKNSDNSVILCYGINIGNDGAAHSLYISNVSVVNLPFPDFCRNLAVFVMENGYTPESLVIVEPKASGISVVQTLKQATSLNIIEDKPPTESKVQRMTAHTAKIEAGRVYLRDGAPFVRNFLHECAAFPGRMQDDQVDCLAMALRQMDVRAPIMWAFPSARHSARYSHRRRDREMLEGFVSNTDTSNFLL